MRSLFDIKVKSIEGQEIDLALYKGKILLIVNVASQCGYTSQYKGLQDLYRDLNGQGLEILCFPCNDFGQQEPGSPNEINHFCKTEYGITFPLFDKVKILGNERHPLYRLLLNSNLPIIHSSWIKGLLFQLIKPLIYLLKGMPSPFPNEVSWNFHKILINRQGMPVAHFASNVQPQDPILLAGIEKEI